ncbi:MAG: hypothetical protein K1X35_00770 [Caulobacteraceae bacterium]|nr:hypothetical protein [Caulobacteraceae bacterium]
MSITLRAQVTIDLNAADFATAADHQRRIEDLMSVIRERYPEASLEFRERRPRPPRALPVKAPMRHYTGAVIDYAER